MSAVNINELVDIIGLLIKEWEVAFDNEASCFFCGEYQGIAGARNDEKHEDNCPYISARKTLSDYEIFRTK